jgi:hypothetical protein
MATFQMNGERAMTGPTGAISSEVIIKDAAASQIFTQKFGILAPARACGEEYARLRELLQMFSFTKAESFPPRRGSLN